MITELMAWRRLPGVISQSCSGSFTSSGLYSADNSSPSTFRHFFPQVRALAYLLYKATVYRLLRNFASGCTQQRNDGMSSCAVVMPGGWPCTSNNLPMDSSQIVPQRGIVFSRFLMRPSVLQIFETSSGT